MRVKQISKTLTGKNLLQSSELSLCGEAIVGRLAQTSESHWAPFPAESPLSDGWDGPFSFSILYFLLSRSPSTYLHMLENV